jgi:hypothetical protein
VSVHQCIPPLKLNFIKLISAEIKMKRLFFTINLEELTLNMENMSLSMNLLIENMGTTEMQQSS